MITTHLKVALLAFEFGEYCARLGGALARQSEVLLLYPRQRAGVVQSRLDQAVNFQPFDTPRLRQPFQQIRMIQTILRRVRHFDPDVVHFQHGHLWFNFALPLLRRYPLVITIHDPQHHVGDRPSQRTPQAIMDFGYRRADQVIVHGSCLKQAVIERLRIRPEIVHAVPMIELGEDTAKCQVEAEDHLILFFGRIWEYKGLEFLIGAEPLITAQVPAAMIMIAGEGEDLARYRRMMVHPDRFIICNEYISDEKCAQLFRQASVVVLPYIDASQSAVIPVAYTFGKPVIATTVGALPEMVDDGLTGLLVPPRDEAALAGAVVRLLRDPALRRQMGLNARQKIATEHSADVVSRKTLAVYRRTIADKKGIVNGVTDYDTARIG